MKIKATLHSVRSGLDLNFPENLCKFPDSKRKVEITLLALSLHTISSIVSDKKRAAHEGANACEQLLLMKIPC